MAHKSVEVQQVAARTVGNYPCSLPVATYIARHFAHSCQFLRHQRRLGTCQCNQIVKKLSLTSIANFALGPPTSSRGGSGSFAARMATADHDHVEARRGDSAAERAESGAAHAGRDVGPSTREHDEWLKNGQMCQMKFGCALIRAIKV
jgi:hypothetical protein